MKRAMPRTGSEAAEAEWPIRGAHARVTSDDIVRAARELVAAYGPEAIALMQRRTRAIRRRGDAESATLWFAVAQAVEEQLARLPGKARAAGD
jgi:hypothetical protein